MNASMEILTHIHIENSVPTLTASKFFALDVKNDTQNEPAMTERRNDVPVEYSPLSKLTLWFIVN